MPRTVIALTAALLSVAVVAVSLALAPPDWFTRLDRDGDGLLDRQEFPSRAFDRLDRDGDGLLTAAEAARPPAPRPAADAGTSGRRVVRDVPYRTIAGGDPRRTSLDLHLPAGGVGPERIGETDGDGDGGGGAASPPPAPRPVVVMIHGGGWRIGDKAAAGVVHPKGDWLLDRGWIMVSVNYRLSPAVQHPAHVDDVRHAIAWVQREIAGYGGDPERVVLMGHSAGAHLAALAAVDVPRLRAAGGQPEGLAGVVLLDGAAYDVPAAMGAARPMARGMYEGAFGLDPAGWSDASPTLRLPGIPAADRAAIPPFLILHVGRPTAAEQSAGLAAALQAAGADATVVRFDEEDHGSINRRLGRPGHRPTEAAAAFLDGLAAETAGDPDGRVQAAHGGA